MGKSLDYKKLKRELAIAVVLGILGFIIAYQLKYISKEEKNAYENTSDVDITSEVSKLSKEKEELSEKVNALQATVSEFEKEAAENNSNSQQLYEQLEKSRMLLGETDVEGPGVVVTITPKVLNVDSTNKVIITHKDLITYVNELNFAGAEAISINGYRITSNKGIRSSDGVKTIYIGNERISPYETITIKAIGSKDQLSAAMNFYGTFKDIEGSYTCSVEKKDSVRIEKSNYTSEFKYSKVIKGD
ncbi:hypothetical protein CM240_1602 [Clostridium bornimense]|uniref:Division initiation protein n=1 Tax=Clostridium bornimense TaxID=1216932 RepID=W6SGB7_9CLOT|nr:DUF881 domain-containing protein [Clostridium bornimense]CDM68760.1 hypothetical protein CM240_1602 [Clostridium bornimense]